MDNVVENNVDQATENLEQNQSESKSFTQDDLNRVGTKEHSKGYSKALKDLGFDDVETAKNALKTYQDWQESQKSETEKQAEALSSKEKELEKALSDKKTLESKLSALSAGVRTDAVDDVIALAERLTNSEVTIDQAISQVLEKYPQFKNQSEEQTVPKFTAEGNPSVTAKTETDPFQDIVDSYVKKKG